MAVQAKFPKMPRPSRNWLVLAAVVIMLAVIFANVPKSSQFLHVLHKTGHPVAFAVMAWIFLVLLENWRDAGPDAGRSRHAWAFAAALAAGIATEVAQVFVHRGASAFDVLRDALGAFAMLTLLAGVSQKRAGTATTRVVILITAGAMAAAAAVFPLLWCSAAYLNRDVRFPLIWQPSTPLDNYFAEIASNSVATGTQDLITDSLVINEPYPDWRHFSSLAFAVTNPNDQDLVLIIRVHDQIHDWSNDDRFNRAVRVAAHSRATITNSLNDIRDAPANRQLNLAQVAGVAIFTANESHGGFFQVNRIWLGR